MLITHVVSFELSLALRDAGYPQEGSTFYWNDIFKQGVYSIGYGKSPVKIRHTKIDGTFTDRKADHIAAPLASELMEKMPGDIPKSSSYPAEYLLTVSKGENGYYANYEYQTGTKTELAFDDLRNQPSLPDALANLLIRLLENKLTTL